MKNISAQGLIDILKNSCKNFPDKRRGNAVKYSMTDATLGAFSIFFTQSPSFLSYQRDMEKRLGRSNSNTLFEMGTIPTDNQIRNILDDVNPELLTSVFTKAFKKMGKAGLLSRFKTDLGQKTKGYLIALDGIEYHSSNQLSCKNCSTKVKGRQTRYSHTALTPVLVNPDKAQVIPLPPEFITPQDGDHKQDCENKATKRWLEKHGVNYSSLEVTILGDDLYSRQPIIKSILNQDFHFILVCKPQSHKWTRDWVNSLETEKETGTKEEAKTKTKKPAKWLKPEDILHTYTTKKWNGKHHIISTYKYALNVPIKEGKKEEEILKVNWVQLTQTREEDSKQLYKNSFITDHQITDENIEKIVKAGRARWKVENENNNTLTTKGYHFKHNYGHGNNHLSTLLASLILIAYLFHTLLELGCKQYQQLREEIVVREVFFNHIKTLTTFFNWDSWDQLFDFMWKKLNDLPATAPE